MFCKSDVLTPLLLQDTVIGLQALSELAATTESAPEMTVMLSYRDISLRKKKFIINSKNAMILQMADVSYLLSIIFVYRVVIDFVSF